MLHSCRPEQIDQVLLNLEFNARDAVPSRGHVMIATQAVTIGTGMTLYGSESVELAEYVMLVMIDNGPGMNPSTMASPRGAPELARTPHLSMAIQQGYRNSRRRYIVIRQAY
ncbi:MAG: hypothetical protein ABI679_06480, partial [Gemmatimonadota bacterium]